MKKRALCALASLVLCVSLTGTAYAAESGVSFEVNGTPIVTEFTSKVENEMTYVSYWPVVQALYPEATAVWNNGQAEVTAPGLTLQMKPGAKYIVANGRYLHVPTGVKIENGTVLVPVRTLCQALGAQVAWNGETQTIVITSGSGPIASGDSFYNQEDLYWLSRIIYCESGNQSLEGKIAVGNVVLNRVASTQFPNTVYNVIFQRNQFTPASNGRIQRTPPADCVVAAKLAMEGVNTAGNALYFINPSISSSRWFSRNCTYVATIGAHAFFA
nr:cell wall hydrolase [uncultured Flavonifractor sp.]